MAMRRRREKDVPCSVTEVAITAEPVAIEPVAIESVAIESVAPIRPRELAKVREPDPVWPVDVREAALPESSPAVQRPSVQEFYKLMEEERSKNGET